MNCAQTVLKKFQRKYALPDAMIEEFEAYGRGNAPGGCCGALYAAKRILEKCCPEKVRELEASFAAAAGSTKCGEIREKRALSCAGCVEKAAGFIAGMEGTCGK